MNGDTIKEANCLNISGSRAWVGGRDISSQNWKWVNGRTISSGFWAVDEPNDSGEDCVELYADKNYYLNDDECYQQKAFICEIQGMRSRFIFQFQSTCFIFC